MLCTINELKTFLGISTADLTKDALLTLILRGVSDRLAREAGRVSGGRSLLEYSTDIEQNLTAERTLRTGLQLNTWPVIHVSSIKEGLWKQYGSVDSLQETANYVVDYRTGEVRRIGFWMVGDMTVRVVYNGGYTPAADWFSGFAYLPGDVVLRPYGAMYTCSTAVSGTTAPESDSGHWTLRQAALASRPADWTPASAYSQGDIVFHGPGLWKALNSVAAGASLMPPQDATNWVFYPREIPLPYDLRNAAMKQAAYEYQRRDKLGANSVSMGSGGSLSTEVGDDLLPDVRETLRHYRRAFG